MPWKGTDSRWTRGSRDFTASTLSAPHAAGAVGPAVRALLPVRILVDERAVARAQVRRRIRPQHANFLVFAGLLPKLLGAKVVLDVHDPVPELVATLSGGRAPSTIMSIARLEERVSVSFSDALITVNEPMRQRLLGATRKELPVSIVMNLPDPSLFAASDLAPTMDTDDPWLVYSGTVTFRHGIDLAIEALGRLTARHPTLKLRIVGTGPALQPAIDQVHGRDLLDRVEFLGMVPLEEIRDVVAGATGALAPHRDDDFGSLVFSVKVAEYLAVGLPVVCARTAGMSYYYAEDELFFFTPGDVDDLARSIDELLADPLGARERAQRGKHKVDLLDWSAQTAAVNEAVESVCQQG